MDNLPPKHRAFIEQMKSGEDFELRGFQLLLERSNFDAFFEALQTHGLFDPERNPGPVAGEKAGYYRLPYWPPLDYLEAVAKRAGERADGTQIDKVLNVVRSVSNWRDVNNKPRDNYTTWYKFAGDVPISVEIGRSSAAGLDVMLRRSAVQELV